MINTEPCIAMKIGQKYLRERKNYKKLSKTYFTLQQKHYRVGHDANLPFTLKGIIFGDFSVRQVHLVIKESFSSLILKQFPFLFLFFFVVG